MLRASATGGVGSRYYKFSYKVGNRTYVIKDFSNKNSASLKLKKSGTYKFYVTVMDIAGNKATKTIGSYKVLPKIQAKKFTVTKKGKTLTINVLASGGVGTKKYQISVKKGTKTKIVSKYSTKKKVTYKIVSKGTYLIKLSVKDSKKHTVSSTIRYRVK